MKEVLLRVEGKVQGVFFRQSTLEYVKSNLPSIKGYVRNLKDGSVEVFAKGYKDEIEKLSEYCQQGPEQAHVTSVLEKSIDNSVETNQDTFTIKY